MQVSFRAKYKAQRVVQSSAAFIALEKLVDYEADLNDPFIYLELEAGNGVVEDDGNVHVTRGHLRIGESIGQERKVLKRDEKRVALAVDEFLKRDDVQECYRQLVVEVEAVNARLNAPEALELDNQRQAAEVEVENAERALQAADQKLAAFLLDEVK